MIRARAQEQLRALLEHQEGTTAGRDPEELHRYRVAIRRLRSLLKGVPAVDPGGELRAELKWLGSLTSPVRDIDVLLIRLDREITVFALPDRRHATVLVRALRAERGGHRRRLNRALASKRYADLLSGLSTLAQSAPEEPEGPDVPPPSLHKPYRKLARAVADLGDDPPDDRLHALRIRGKRLRYAAETAKPAADKARRRQLAALVTACKKLQDTLGEHQDAVVAAAKIRELAAAQDDVAVAFVAGRLAEREQARRAAARTAWPTAWQRVSTAATAVL
ncbi:MAG: CHAD domain-containing protein [Thermocrispum sp.]